MSDTGSTDDFVSHLTGSQRRLYAYVLSLMASRFQAEEVLQEVNLVLWRKAAEFEPGTNFIAWAFRIASYQVTAHRQKAARDRLVFDNDLILTISEDVQQDDEAHAQRQEALTSCLQKLPASQRDLVRFRYSESVSVDSIGQLLQKTPNSVTKTLHRIRMALLKCIELTVAGLEGSQG